MEDKPDNKPTVYTQDPFSYNYVSIKNSKVNDLPVPSQTQVVTDTTYNTVGKMLGVSDPQDWEGNYDKVFTIVEWAKERSGLKDPQELANWIKDMSKYSFVFGSKKIDNLFNRIRSIKDGKVN